MRTIRLIISSEDAGVLDKTVCDIIDAFVSDTSIFGPFPIPTKTERFKGGDRNVVVHKRIMELEDVTDKTVDILMKIQIPIGVDVIIKLGE